MENRIPTIHISYKHDIRYKDSVENLKKALNDNQIPFSIDEHDLKYRNNIEDYEKKIGQADKIIMFVTPGYLTSFACMFEMSQMFANGNVRERLFPIVDLGDIKRNGDGLTRIKRYWLQEKEKKAEELKQEAGSSNYRIEELRKINGILCTLDELWEYLVQINTGNIEELMMDNATMLIEELKKASLSNTVSEPQPLLCSKKIKSRANREINQFGTNSVYIESSTGDITFN